MAALPLLLALGLTACSSDDEGSTDAGGTAPTSESSPSASMDEDSTAAGPFGAACSAVPSSGAGSFDGMSADPVATAASNNPVLSTLVTAVGEAGLVDTLNSAQNITVFAPTNDAFAAIPEADLNALLADKEALTRVLTYHVVGKTIEPDELGSGGPFETLAGPEVTASGSGEQFTVGDGGAKVVCGNVMTANARVYLIDQVLMPPAA